MWVREKGGHAILSCRVAPNSSREGLGGIMNDALLIRLNAPAVEGRANEALIRFLSKHLGVSKSRISLFQGHKGRNKLVVIEGLTPEEIASGLGLSLRP